MRCLLFSLIALTPLAAEEGMWPLNQIPQETIENTYGIQLTPAWIEHVQKASLRVSLGGSASFVSSTGLFITNHHVGARAIYNLSTDGNDLLTNGFYAKTPNEELPCPNCYVDQLISMEDVTGDIQAKIHIEDSIEMQEQAKSRAILDIQQQAQERTGLQPEVVSLYQGARYTLYLYRRYTDIRLVMAPEKAIAFFGGDPENFEYPRYALDMAFFRVYDQGHPLHSPDFFTWSTDGPKEGGPLFVSGNPGKTRRMFTAAHLSFLDSIELPLRLYTLQQRKKTLNTFSQISPEQKRIALQDLFQIENSLKVVENVQQGLASRLWGWKKSPILQAKEIEEQKLFTQVSPQPWQNLAHALQQAKNYYPAYMILEGSLSNYSLPYQWAKCFVRLARELPLPQSERLKEFGETELPALSRFLLSPEPVYPNLEEAKMADSFRHVKKILGRTHPVTQIVFADHSATERAHELIQATKLFSLAFRQELYLHPETIDTTQDPLLQLARALDPYARKLRIQKETELDHVANESYTKIAQTLFQLYGDHIYPDATFTLRLSFGSMRGYGQIAPTTQLQGAFQSAQTHRNQEPYQLPNSWIARKSFLDLATPFNFISTNDIIGGNSGSPVINAQGEFVGLIFDGNQESILWDYRFDDRQGRAISVHSQAILQVLEKVYQAEALVEEIRRSSSGV